MNSQVCVIHCCTCVIDLVFFQVTFLPEPLTTGGADKRPLHAAVLYLLMIVQPYKQSFQLMQDICHVGLPEQKMWQKILNGCAEFR